MDRNPASSRASGPEGSPAGTSRPTTAKRRTGKARVTQEASESRIGLPEPEYLNLGDAREDIVEAAEAVPVSDIVQPLPPDAILSSQPSEKVYIQEVAGFRKAQRQQYENSLLERQKQAVAEAEGIENGYVHTTAEAIQTGIMSQNAFRTLAVTLQGLLAGFTIAHCLMVVFNTPPYFSNSHFINHYAPVALPAHCLYYITLVISALAALDRYDIGQSFLRALYRAFTFQSGGLAVICYLAATIVNQVSVAADERMTLYYRNATATAAATADHQQFPLTDQLWMESDIQLWRGCLIAKAVLVTATWIMVAVRPSTDLLTKHLRQADEDFAREFETPKQEMHGNPAAAAETHEV